MLGSSHGDYGYVPCNGEYNLCIPSQDLYYSGKLYEKYVDDMPCLQNVILFYSVFSSGFCLEKTSEKFYCLPYFKISYIKPQTKEAFDNIKTENKQYYACLDLLDEETKVPKNYLGENLDKKGHGGGRIGFSNVQERAEKHLKNNQRGDLELKFLRNLIDKIDQNHHRLFIVIAPAHREYKACLPSGDKLFVSLKNMLVSYDKEVEIIDLYNNFDLPDDCWWDYDHLNRKGAQIVTVKIRERIQD